MWRKYKKRFWWFFVGLCFGLTPYIFYLADMERGYNATGGEIFILIVPVLVWMIKETVCDGKNRLVDTIYNGFSDRQPLRIIEKKVNIKRTKNSQIQAERHYFSSYD